MAIKIQTKKTGIPVEIGSLNFEFDTSDGSIAKFEKTSREMIKELQEVEMLKDDSEQFIVQGKEVLERAFDFLLGDGAFKQIYAETSSIILLMNYLTQLTNGIGDELKELGLDNKKANAKYLKKAK